MCCAENVEAELQQGARRGDISYDGNHGIGRAFGGGSSLPAGTWTHAGVALNNQPSTNQSWRAIQVKGAWILDWFA